MKKILKQDKCFTRAKTIKTNIWGKIKKYRVGIKPNIFCHSNLAFYHGKNAIGNDARH